MLLHAVRWLFECIEALALVPNATQMRAFFTLVNSSERMKTYFRIRFVVELPCHTISYETYT